MTVIGEMFNQHPIWFIIGVGVVLNGIARVIGAIRGKNMPFLYIDNN